MVYNKPVWPPCRKSHFPGNNAVFQHQPLFWLGCWRPRVPMAAQPPHHMNLQKMVFFILLQLSHMKRRTTVIPHPPQVRGVLLPGGCVATSLDARAPPWEHTRHCCPWKHFPKLGSKALLYHTECEQLQEITQGPGCPQHYHPFSLSLSLEKRSSCKYFILDTFILDTVLLEYPDFYV